MTSAQVPVKVLIVDSNPADVHLLRQALEGSISCQITVLENGEDAINYLAAAPLVPDIVVMDVLLPRHDGTEVLDFIRAYPPAKNTLVALLGTPPEHVISDSLNESLQRADFYSEKPMDMDAFLRIGAKIWNMFRLRSRASRIIAAAAPPRRPTFV